jgi:hypothetical protein
VAYEKSLRRAVCHSGHLDAARELIDHREPLVSLDEVR